ncbi:MAG: FkbM family methyltransferase [Planctomycetes bacterium]|nr:FkbM family methyltransferase [Planctomycetota bacterium]
MFLASLVRRAAARLRGRPHVPRAALDSGSMRGGIARAAYRGPGIGCVVDVGASDGGWSRLAHEYYPDAEYLLIEAQTLHADGLRRFCGEGPKARYELVAAGPRDGTIHFDAQDPFGGAAGEQPTGPSDVVVPMRSIDSLVAQHGLSGPFLIKLDTHGFEKAILQGAAATLRRAELLIIEAYNFKLNDTDPNCLRFHELCAWLEQRGFRCIDLCDVSRRRCDRVLWQMDMFFAPLGRPEFQSNEFR